LAIYSSLFSLSIFIVDYEDWEKNLYLVKLHAGAIGAEPALAFGLPQLSALELFRIVIIRARKPTRTTIGRVG
jgi:hypothetical protein